MPVCELCRREVLRVSRHHLTPLEKGGRNTPTVNLCQPCHTTLHHTFTNNELARIYNTIGKLLEAEPLQKYLHWIKNKNLERIPVKKRKS